MRRHSLIAVISITFLTLFVSPVYAEKPIKIGFIFVTSGALATFGTISKQGAELAVDHLNETGGINGRKLVGIYEDSGGEPAHAAKALKKLVSEDKVDVVIGPSLSSVAKELTKHALEYATPLIIPVALTPDVTGRECNRYTFRICQNLNQNLKSAAIVAADLKANTWTTIGPDYVYGRQSWQYFKTYLKQLRPTTSFLSGSEAVFGSTDTENWRPLIQKVMTTNCNGVLVSLFGRNLIDFVRQAREVGFFDRRYQIIMNIGASIEVMTTLHKRMPRGLWLGAPYWFEATSNDANIIFVRQYRTKYKAVPSYMAHGAYAAVLAYAAAAKATGSVAKEAIRSALEGLTVDLPVGKVTIRMEDHQAITPGILGKTAESAFRFPGLRPMKVIPGDQITPSWEETGCKMPGLAEHRPISQDPVDLN